jgi:hypothetical protein
MSPDFAMMSIFPEFGFAPGAQDDDSPAFLLAYYRASAELVRA